MTRYNHIVVLTGAGLSAESGLHTFRDKDGIWARHDYREVATSGRATTGIRCWS